MNGEQVQDLIYDWLVKFYPDGPGWHDPDFDCYGDAPIEIKMVSAFDILEYNISNGGWSQFLWNCLPHWRRLLAIAKEGYLLIGASEQSAAMDKLQALCARDERACLDAQAHDTGDDSASFADFTSRSYQVLDDETEWEDLFFTTSSLYDLRLAWLAANEARVRKAVEALHR